MALAQPLTAVYTSLAGSGELLVLHARDASTALQEVQRIKLGGAPMPMAFSPDRRHLYVIGRSAPFVVHTLAINPVDGTLNEPIASPLPGNMAYASTTLDGRFLLTASYGDDFVAVNAIDQTTGIVGETLQRLPTPRHAHAIVAAPEGKAVWISCLGADALPHVSQDQQTGLLATEPNWTHACRANSGPRHFVFHPHALWCFVINERDGTIDSLALGPSLKASNNANNTNEPPKLAHSISMMADDFTGEPWAAEIRLSPDGQWLFASDRRSGTLVSFKVDAASGQLTWVHRLVVDTMPRSFALAPDGQSLFVVDQQSGLLHVLRVDRDTGHMQHVSQMKVGLSPTWVEALSLGE